MKKELQLPEGVPADNSALTAGGAAPFPETAAPQFASDTRSHKKEVVIVPQSGTPIIIEDADEDDSKKEQTKPSDKDDNLLPVALAVTALFVSVLAILIAYNAYNHRLPFCADLPEWNQYNCRTS